MFHLLGASQPVVSPTRRSTWLVPIVFAGLALAACGSDDSASSETSAASTEAVASSTTVAAPTTSTASSTTKVAASTTSAASSTTKVAASTTSAASSAHTTGSCAGNQAVFTIETGSDGVMVGDLIVDFTNSGASVGTTKRADVQLLPGAPNRVIVGSSTDIPTYDKCSLDLENLRFDDTPPAAVTRDTEVAVRRCMELADITLGTHAAAGSEEGMDAAQAACDEAQIQAKVDRPEGLLPSNVAEYSVFISSMRLWTLTGKNDGLSVPEWAKALDELSLAVEGQLAFGK